MNKKSGSDLSGLLKKDLLARAKELGLTGLSRLRKQELIDALSQAAPRKPAPNKKSTPPKKTTTRRGGPPRPPAAKKPRPPAAPAKPRFKPEELQDLDQGMQDLPDVTGENRIVLLPRDPSWLFAYWELTPEFKEAARTAGGTILALRLHDVTNVAGAAVNSTSQHEVSEWARSWYLPVPKPERDYVVEIGYSSEDRDQWFPLVRSNTVAVPAEQPSAWVARQVATILPEEALPAANAAAAPRDDGDGAETPRPSENMAQVLVQEGDMRIVLETRSPAEAASLGFSAGHMEAPGSLSHLPGSLGHLPEGASAASPLVLNAINKQRGGFEQLPSGQEGIGQPLLEASVELVIAGRAYPGTHLTVADHDIPVGPDGAFSLRISVPEGAQEVPIEAENEATGNRQRINFRLGRTVD